MENKEYIYIQAGSSIPYVITNCEPFINAVNTLCNRGAPDPLVSNEIGVIILSETTVAFEIAQMTGATIKLVDVDEINKTIKKYEGV